MKRAREQSVSSVGSRVALTGATVRSEKMSSGSLKQTIVRPTSATSSKIGPKQQQQQAAAPRVIKKNESKPKMVITRLPPPPPIQPFSDDIAESNEEEGSALSRETKKVRTLPKEDEAWRVTAKSILANGPIAVGKGTSRRNFAVVCSSNVNRSIMAQKLLEKHDMRAKSYGTGR